MSGVLALVTVFLGSAIILVPWALRGSMSEVGRALKNTHRNVIPAARGSVVRLNDTVVAAIQQIAGVRNSTGDDSAFFFVATSSRLELQHLAPSDQLVGLIKSRVDWHEPVVIELVHNDADLTERPFAGWLTIRFTDASTSALEFTVRSAPGAESVAHGRGRFSRP